MTMIDQPLHREAVRPTPRRKMTAARKRRIAERQAFKCAKCAVDLPFPFDVDHVLPLELGGPEDDGNLEALCIACHATKTREDRQRIKKVHHLTGETCVGPTKRPLRSRGFDKRLSRGFDGKVRPKPKRRLQSRGFSR